MLGVTREHLNKPVPAQTGQVVSTAHKLKGNVCVFFFSFNSKWGKGGASNKSKKNMTLLEIFKKIRESSRLTPGEIVFFKEQLSTVSAQMEVELGEIENEKAIWFSENRANFKSDKATELSWSVLPRGQRENKLRREIKGTDKMISALNTRIRLLENEAKGIW